MLLLGRMKINTFVRKRKRWFRGAFRLKYSVFPDVWEKSLFFAIFSLIICLLYTLGFAVQQPILSSLIPTIVLGLLLVFRTNSANDRFWEGRKLWGGIVNNLRNLTWQIWVNIQEESHHDRTHKIQALNLLTVFAIASKNHLRSEGISEEMESLLSPYYYHHLQTSQHFLLSPLSVILFMG